MICRDLTYIQWLGVNRIIDGRGDGREAARCCSADASDLISFITGDPYVSAYLSRHLFISFRMRRAT